MKLFLTFLFLFAGICHGQTRENNDPVLVLQDGTTVPMALSGTWTASPTSTTNLDSVSGGTGYFTRVGNYVWVWVQMTVDATSSGSDTEFQLNVPVTTANFSGSGQAVGQYADRFGGSGVVAANSGAQTVEVRFVPQTAGATGATVVFGYEIQ